MNTKIRNVILALGIVAASLGTAVAVERASLAAGERDAVGSAAVSDAGVAIDASLASVRDHRTDAGVAPAVTTLDAPVINPAPPSDPIGLLAQFVSFARTGKGRLAVGTLLVLIVWSLGSPIALGRFAFWSTKLGKYVLGFGSASLLYVGTALLSDQVAITFNLIGDALVAGFAASGKWEALRDALAKPGARVAAVTSASIALFVTGVYLTVSIAGCAQVKPIVEHAKDSIVDCTKAEIAHSLPDLVHEFECRAGIGTNCPMMESPLNWDLIQSIALSKGQELGGCAIATFVQHYLAPPPGRMAPAIVDGQQARQALEHYRATYVGGATFRTAEGDL